MSQLVDLTHNPVVLLSASIERMEAARLALDPQRDYVLAIYLGGLSVECVLQAVVLRAGAAHDAKHNLPQWLARCPRRLQDTLKSPGMRQDWNEVVSTWSNSIRYLSTDGLVGRLRQLGRGRGQKGGPGAMMRKVAVSFLNAADRVLKKGQGEWALSKKS